MKLNSFLYAPSIPDPQQTVVPIQQQSERLRTPTSNHPPERIRHILVGSPGSIRQTIHLLHTLGYSETLLWSPIATVENSIVINPYPRRSDEPTDSTDLANRNSLRN